jgi:hypothetical protein
VKCERSGPTNARTLGRFAITALVVLFTALTGSARAACAAEPALPSGTETSANLSIGAAGQLAARGSDSHKLTIDVTAPCMFLLLTSVGDVELVMTSPSGKTWSSHHPANEGEGGHVSENPLEFMSGGMSMVKVEAPEPGEWTAKMIVHSMPDSVAEIDYVLEIAQNTGERGPVLHSLIPDRTYHRGEIVPVRVSLLEGRLPVTGAKLNAAAGFAGREAEEFLLRDDGVSPDSLSGDGIYSGVLPRLASDGIYQLAVFASRDAASGAPAFQRTIEQTLRVSRTASHLTGKYSDFTRDTDHDGTPDELVIGVGVHVTEPGVIGVMGSLSGANCPAQYGRVDPRLLPAGDQVLELSYSLKDLSRQCGAGSFQLDELTLFEEKSMDAPLIVLDQPPHPVYRTRNYTADELIYESIQPTGEATVQGIDEDRDGKFEYLAVDMPVILRLDGTYAWAVLLERDGEIASQGSGISPLPKGRSVMRFLFPGSCLAKAPEGGQYVLRDFSMNYAPTGPHPTVLPRALDDAPDIPLRGVPAPGRFDPANLGSQRTHETGDENLYATYYCD